ncbi:peptidyl-dipeptidase Dcp [Acidipila sp. EB88]|uniref:peptidyl-dipeptidase Dcp n=1 Tax=Acidipila sp. EB88 TaxID=2305226 RepID=UPI001F2031E4|nr:peptidyl-dipeptidase Dcp [Acidipila sp. EB88]
MRMKTMQTWMAAGAIALGSTAGGAAQATGAGGFGPSNPFYGESTLPFHAPPFDRIHDADYQPAIEAGMREHLREIDAIANDPTAPTFDNTLVAMERSGLLLQRVLRVFSSVTGANTNPVLQKVQQEEAPRQAAHNDAIYLNSKLFARVKAIHDQRTSLHLDAEQLRLVKVTYDQFLRAGAQLSDADKAQLRQLNERESTLSNAFETRLLAATKAGAYTTTDKAALAGLSDAQLAAAAQAASARKQQGYVLPLQNTTQQPALASLTQRSTRQALFQDSLERAERPGDNDTRDVIAQLAQVRAHKAKLLGFSSYAAWKLGDQMAKTPEAALHFMDALVPAATAKAQGEAAEIQKVIDAQNGGFQLEAWDWDFYAEQVRKARYDLDEAELKPYFEIDKVLENGVFYAAHLLYGISFKERKDIPVYEPDVRVFEVTDSNGKPLALFYCDYWKRDNKNGGAWMSEFVGQSRLLGTLPVVYNVANFTKPAPGQPALISFDDVTTMFHEFGHALHGMFADSMYPSLSGTSVPRDFVEFPSQFNEHWAMYPEVFAHYARNYQTGAAMPAELTAKLQKARTFNQGYALTELLAAAELDMQWHTLPADAPLQKSDEFEQQALEKTRLALKQVPPRYRSSYFMHIWGNGYAAGYYAYLWSEMLDDDAFQWFQDHGGLTRANGDRFRQMVLSRGNSADLESLYKAWLGADPSAKPMLKYRGLEDSAAGDTQASK